MNTARTWLSLVGFSVTLRTLHTLRRATAVRVGTPRPEVLTLLAVGIVLVGIANHLSFIFETHRRHAVATGRAVRPRGRPFSWSLAFIVALTLVMIGIVAISSVVYEIARLGPR